MKVQIVSFERLRLKSFKTFEAVLSELEQRVSRSSGSCIDPKLNGDQRLSQGYRNSEDVHVCNGLSEMHRWDFRELQGTESSSEAYRAVRIMAGDPQIMRELVLHVPDAGSYAPISILLYENNGEVNLCYDTMESLLASYKCAPALELARKLDLTVIKLLNVVAG